MSKRKELDYETFRTQYRDPATAANYDARRFTGLARRMRNRRMFRAVKKAFGLIEAPRLVIDLPCGTGRFFEFLTGRGASLVGADISEMMLAQATAKTKGASGAQGRALGLVAADATKLPFKDKSADAILSIRFLHQVPPDVRAAMLREMGRVARGHLVLEYRLRYALKNIGRIILSRFGLKPPLKRVTRRQMLDELAAAGLEFRAAIPVTPFFGDKYVVVCGAAGKPA